MAALVFIYNNGRPLASTVFPISIFARYCTGSGICADCYYSPGGFGVHAYYTGSMLYLMADATYTERTSSCSRRARTGYMARGMQQAQFSNPYPYISERVEK